ncbi:FadR/GntR family transcriptional regulator [Prosthecomicrobium sp. N25]|uniref:FadR/GntR family transcriptional regulator n=1 Tax=Prosthecomicrobium sp. N25 TaxID=3129254 RepID=UPI003077A785
MNAEADLDRRIDTVLQEMVGPGGRLPTERALAERLGATRHAVRKSLARLENQGRLWRHVGRGTFAGARPVADASDPERVGQYANPREILETRQILERHIAGLAAVRASPAQIAAIEEASRRCAAARSMDLYEIWDENFHRALAAATGNVLLQSLFETVNRARKQVVWGSMRRAVLRPERRQFFSDQHARIVEAIRHRNADAAFEAMHAHMATIGEVYATLEATQAANRPLIL